MKNLKLALVALALSGFMYACGSSESTTEQNQDTAMMMEEEEPMAEEETQPIMTNTETQSAGTAGAASASITTPPTGAATTARNEAQQQTPATTTAQQQTPATSGQQQTPATAAKPAQTTPKAGGPDAALVAQGKTLVEGSDCRACHAVDSKLVGPSFQEIAERYQKDPKAVDMLAGKIIEGGAGNWGQIPMSPHPQISKADASKMVQYILALNK